MSENISRVMLIGQANIRSFCWLEVDTGVLNPTTPGLTVMDAFRAGLCDYAPGFRIDSHGSQPTNSPEGRQAVRLSGARPRGEYSSGFHAFGAGVQRPFQAIVPVPAENRELFLTLYGVPSSLNLSGVFGARDRFNARLRRIIAAREGPGSSNLERPGAQNVPIGIFEASSPLRAIGLR